MDEQAARFAAVMERRGAWPEDAPWVRQAMTDLPRHCFAPAVLHRWDGRLWREVHRHREPVEWAGLVYADPNEPAITQILDGAPSSSLSCAAVVADMLDSAEVEPGHRVLELGTGTGWNAALLAWRTGPAGRVVSVETDPDLARQAEENLTTARAGTGVGTGPRVVVRVGDGTAGWPPGAPFDRVVSTFAVEEIPASWVEQTRPGGLIVTPWGRLGHLALTVAPGGRRATGRFHGLAAFMPARGTPNGPARDYSQIRGTTPAPAESIFPREPAGLEDAGVLWALRVALPDVHIRTAHTDTGTDAWLHDGTQSWAMLTTTPGRQTVACQGGPRRLAHEAEQAWERWEAIGSPHVFDYGMTIDLDTGTQWVWAVDETVAAWPVRPPNRLVQPS